MQTGRFVDWMRIDPPVLKVGFGVRDKESLGQRRGVESGEIDITPIHDVETASLENDLIEDIDIVELAVRDMNESRDVAPQTEERMEFDRPFALAKTRPGKERQAQVDRGRVEGIDCMRPVSYTHLTLPTSDLV